MASFTRNNRPGEANAGKANAGGAGAGGAGAGGDNAGGAGAGGAGAGGANNKEVNESNLLENKIINNFNNNHIFIFGHGAIDSDKFIISPEHIHLKFYTNKGNSLFGSQISSNYKYFLKLHNDSKHYIQEKTLLNDMMIDFKNMYEYKENKKLFSDVSNFFNIHKIDISGIINQKFKDIGLLDNEVYQKYNIQIDKIDYVENILLDDIKESYDFDKEYVENITMTKLNDIIIQFDNLIKNINGGSIMTNELLKEMNSMNVKNKMKIISEIFKKYKNNEIIKEPIYRIYKKYFDIINNYYTICEIYDFLGITFKSFNSEKTLNILVNLLSYKVTTIHFIQLYLFENIIGFNTYKNGNGIYILNNLLKSFYKLPEDYKKEIIIILFNIYLKNKNIKNYRSIGQLINETLLPDNYNEIYINVWPNIRDLSFHFHNNDIIPKEKIIENNFEMNLGEILYYIDIYNKNVLNNQTIICHGLNCRNYTPIEKNKKLSELRNAVNHTIVKMNKHKELLKNATNVNVHRLIRQQSASQIYKDLFENIIEKCINIINNNINKINSNNNKNYNEIRNIHQRLMSIYNQYIDNHFLVKEDIQFLIRILGRNES